MPEDPRDDYSCPRLRIAASIGHFMALIAAHHSALAERSGLTVNPEASRYRHSGERCSCEAQPMAGLAAVLVVFIETFVAVIIPSGIIDIMQAVGAAGRPRQASRSVTG